MSLPIGSVDIVTNGQPIKIGEMQFNDDNTLEGFLFENSAAVFSKVMQENPASIIFSVMVVPAQPAEPPKETSDGSNFHQDQPQ